MSRTSFRYYRDSCNGYHVHCEVRSETDWMLAGVKLDKFELGAQIIELMYDFEVEVSKEKD